MSDGSRSREERLVTLFQESWRLSADERLEIIRRVRAEDTDLGTALDALLSQVAPGVTAPESLARQIQRRYGAEAGFQIDLEPEEEAEGAEFVTELVRRLSDRGEGYSRYALKGEIARGGQGAILRVWDRDLRRSLAMKVVLGRGEASEETPAVDSKTLGRFLEEAQVTGQLDHPGIVPIHELGLDATGHVYFTMKLVKGEDLRAVFERVQRGDDDWNQTRALGVLLRVCEAMAFAHSKRVIHRDLKPGNVMVGRFGEVFVMDWGLARVLGTKDDRNIRIRPSMTSGEVRSDRRDASDVESPLITMDGDVVGTPAYMSPEQARGDLEAMGPHSDVYALGAMLYHLLTGHMPYVRPEMALNNYGIWYQVQEGPPAPLHEEAPHAPAELVAICERAMQRSVAVRYPDMQALAEDLRAFLENRVVQAYETGSIAELRKWVGRNRALAGTIAAAILALVAGLFVSLHLKEQSDANAASASAGWTESREQERIATEALALAERRNYRAFILAAQAAHERGGHADAKRLLALCPEEHRQWEWHHMALAFDQSLTTRRSSEGSSFEDVMLAMTRSSRVYARSLDGSWIALSGIGQVSVHDTHEDSWFEVPFRSERVVSGLAISMDGTHLGLLETQGDEVFASAVVVETGEAIATRKLENKDPLSSLGLQFGIVGYGGERQLEFLPGSRAMLIGAWGAPRIWNFYGKQRDTILMGRASKPLREAGSMTASPDGQSVFGLYERGQVWRFDAATGELVQAFAGKGDFSCLSVSLDGRQLAVGHRDGTIQIFDVASENENLQLEQLGLQFAQADETSQTFPSDTAKATMVLQSEEAVSSVAFSASGRELVTGSSSDALRVWDLRTGNLRGTLRGHVRPIVDAFFFQDDRRILSYSAGGSLRVWDSATRGVFQQIPGVESGSETLLFDPSGETLVTPWGERSLLVRDMDSGEWRHPLEGHEASITTATISEDGSLVAAGSFFGRVLVWDVETAEILHSLQGPRVPVTSLDFTEDAQRLAASFLGPTGQVWHLAGGRPPLVLEEPPFLTEITELSFTERDSAVLGLAQSGNDLLWDAKTGSLTRTRAQYGEPPRMRREPWLSRHGEFVITVRSNLGGGTTLGFFDFHSGDAVRHLGVSGRVEGIALTPDGRRVAVLSRGTAEGAVVRILDTSSGEAMLTLDPGLSIGPPIGFSASGQLIASLPTGDLCVWDTDLERSLRVSRTAREMELPVSLLSMLFSRHLLPEAVIDVLEEEAREAGLTSDELARARELAETWVQPTVTDLNSKAWRIVDPDGDGTGEEVELALTLARIAVERAPENAAVRDTLAWALHANGLHDEALSTSEQALELADEEVRQEYQGYLDRLRSSIGDRRD